MTLAHLCPACGTIRTERGRCAACRVTHTDPGRDRRFPQRAGYRTTAYREARRVALHRDEVCVSCGSPKDRTVDHIDGDTMNNDPSNLRVLCRRCHAAHHGNQRGAA